MTNNIQYIVDYRGNTTSVVIPIKVWDKLTVELPKPGTNYLQEKKISPGKARKLTDFNNALNEVKLHLIGKKKLKTLDQLIDEL